MSISGVSDITSSLSQQASLMQGNKVQQQIGVAILKQTMDQQKTAGEAIVKMIQNGPGSPGSLVDIRA
jgi:hypothetical protein